MLMCQHIRYHCLSALNLCSSLLNCYLTMNHWSYTASGVLFVQEDPFFFLNFWRLFPISSWNIWIIYLFFNFALPKFKAPHISANYKIFRLLFKFSGLGLQFNFELEILYSRKFYLTISERTSIFLCLSYVKITLCPFVSTEKKTEFFQPSWIL